MKISKVKKIILGFGLSDYSGSVLRTDGSGVLIYKQFYRAWRSMLDRCYSDKYKARHESYIGCAVCDEWLSLSKFKEWFDDNYVKGWQLDKDLLVQGNKIYAPEYCRYVPRQLNTLLCNASSSRGECPQGVHIERKTGKFIVQIKMEGKRVNLGRFESITEASLVYKKEKAKYVLSKVDSYRGYVDSDLLDSVYKRFINY